MRARELCGLGLVRSGETQQHRDRFGIGRRLRYPAAALGLLKQSAFFVRHSSLNV